MRRGLTRVEAALARQVRKLVLADPVLAAFDGAACALTLEAFGAEPWASLTFSGHRHRLRVGLRGPAAAVEAALGRLELLAEAEPPVFDGQVLIDLVIGEAEIEPADGGVRASVPLEALTIEE